MSQHPIELILTQHLASYLTMPVFLVDPQGDLLYYNEPAERILGCRFDETGPMTAEQWATIFLPTDADGGALAPEKLPLMVTLSERAPAQGRFFISGLDGVRREIAVWALPLIGQGEHFVGAMALFWEPT